MSDIYIYHRCSTDSQQFMQQQECVKGYCTRMGISPNSIKEIVTEKVSGTVNHTERKLAGLIKKCKYGDTILVSELSRLGRNMSDLFAIVTECCNRGIVLIQCKDGSSIENTSIGGKALLFALSLAAEIEVANIRQRTQMGLDAIKDKLRRGDEYIGKKSGKVVTHLGREKGVDTSKASAARGLQQTLEKEEWRRTNEGYKAVRRWVREGRKASYILKEFNTFHESCPEHFSTPSGGQLTLAIYYKWARDIRQEPLE